MAYSDNLNGNCTGKRTGTNMISKYGNRYRYSLSLQFENFHVINIMEANFLLVLAPVPVKIVSE